MKIISSIRKYFPLLGVALFAIILYKSDFEKILQNISNIKPLYLLFAIILSFPIFFTKSLCWNYIKRQQGIKYSLKDSFLMYGSGLYIGSFTPARIGDFAKVLYLKNDGYSTGKSLVAAILDRLSDIAFVLIFIFIGSLFFLNIISKQVAISLIIILASVALFIILFKIGFIKLALKKIFYIFIPQKYQKTWKINFQDFINDIKIYKLKDYLIMLLITALSWFFYYLQMYILSKGTNINLPFLYLAISISVAGLITLIPVSISGIGTRDAALIILFAPFLVAKEQTIVFSALILMMYLFSALMGLICWLIKPIKI